VEFIFLDVLVLCFLCVNYVNVYVIFLVNYVLGYVVSPEEGRHLLLKHSVAFDVRLSMHCSISVEKKTN